MKKIILVAALLAIASHASFAQNAPPGSAKVAITLQDAVNLFLQRNLQLIAARYDVDVTEAEKLSARVRPNPQVSVESSGLPLKFNGISFQQQTLDYTISQTFELGGKRAKRIDAANANSAVAQAQFEAVVWQLTNDVKKKFYTALLDASLLNLARENQRTFGEIVEHTRDVFKSGEISGLDLQRLEIERLKFDSDVAKAESEYELAVRDLRVTLGGDYLSTNIEAAGTIEYYESYDFSFSDMRDKALAARPDLKAARLSEAAADAAIRLQNAQKVPDVTLSGGVEQVVAGGSNYIFGVGVTLPISDRNQTERAKALIEKQRAQNQQTLVTNQIVSDVDKAVIAFDIQKRRLNLYRTGILTKVANIQDSTEFALRSGDSSILELLDAIRTRRDTLAEFYQTIFDYQSAVLDLELATATPLLK